MNYNGFFQERQSFIDDMLEDEKPEGFDEFGFEFMQNEAVEDNLLPYDFLHGDCNLFAQYLHKKYGYAIEAVYQYGSSLVHMYNYYEPEPGRIVYVDVRGKCDDYDYFMAEFYDNGLWDNDDYSRCVVYDDISKIPAKYRKDNKYSKKRMADAEQVVELYNYYSFDAA